MGNKMGKQEKKKKKNQELIWSSGQFLTTTSNCKFTKTEGKCKVWGCETTCTTTKVCTHTLSRSVKGRMEAWKEAHEQINGSYNSHIYLSVIPPQFGWLWKLKTQRGPNQNNKHKHKNELIKSVQDFDCLHNHSCRIFALWHQLKQAQITHKTTRLRVYSHATLKLCVAAVLWAKC